jgi:hypothetical protein
VLVVGLTYSFIQIALGEYKVWIIHLGMEHCIAVSMQMGRECAKTYKYHILETMKKVLCNNIGFIIAL